MQPYMSQIAQLLCPADASKGSRGSKELDSLRLSYVLTPFQHSRVAERDERHDQHATSLPARYCVSDTAPGTQCAVALQSIDCRRHQPVRLAEQPLFNYGLLTKGSRLGAELPSLPYPGSPQVAVSKRSQRQSLSSSLHLKTTSYHARATAAIRQATAAPPPSMTCPVC